MKGILLAGGKGTRLWPATAAINKHLIPIYDKPMIYYSLSTLMLAQVREVILISDQIAVNQFKNLLGNGSKFGMSIEYAIQQNPEGIPQALILAEKFLEGDDLLLVLGDNITYGATVGRNLQSYTQSVNPQILTKSVSNPSAFGVATYDAQSRILNLEEKPQNRVSNDAILGVYFLPNNACEVAKTLHKSVRGEFEIVDILREYLDNGALQGHRLPKGTVWLDTGSVEGLNAASEYIRILQDRHGEMICSPEQIALNNGWISSQDLIELLSTYPTNEYSNKLREIVSEGKFADEISGN